MHVASGLFAPYTFSIIQYTVSVFKLKLICEVEVSEEGFWTMADNHLDKEFGWAHGVIFFPSVESVTELSKDMLEKANLPNGILLNTIQKAFDINGDDNPDFLITQFCCGAPETPLDQCTYHCGKNFTKTDSGWLLTATWSPR